MCRGGFGLTRRRQATPPRPRSDPCPRGCQKKSGCLWLLAHGEPRLPPLPPPPPPQASSCLGLAGTELGHFVTILSVRTGVGVEACTRAEKDSASLGPQRVGQSQRPPGDPPPPAHPSRPDTLLSGGMSWGEKRSPVSPPPRPLAGLPVLSSLPLLRSPPQRHRRLPDSPLLPIALPGSDVP